MPEHPTAFSLNERVARYRANDLKALPVGFIVVVETQSRYGLSAPIALAYAATFSNPVDALNAVKRLGGANEKVRVVAEMQKTTTLVLGLSSNSVKQL